MKNLILLAILCIVFASTTIADLKIIDNTADFNKLIQESKVPVIVKFSAYWWNACASLKSKLEKIAPNYSDDQVVIGTVDAYVNSDLKKYLDGGYPTIRVFNNGKTTNSFFVGNKSETFVVDFINKVVNDTTVSSPTINRGELKELKNTQEFENVIRNANVPVLVKFSAHWWGACQVLKKTLVKIAPSYSDKQVLLCTVDASVNSDLKKYLLGGYPTVRIFNQGKTSPKSFVGSKSESFIKSFIDDVINNDKKSEENKTTKKREDLGNFIELKTTQEFNDLIANAKVPVIIKFSAHWWGACKNLKKKLVKIAADYSTDQVLIGTVDAYVNSDLKKCLLGGYPTVRVFRKGKIGSESFVGNKNELSVREFIDSIINSK